MDMGTGYHSLTRNLQIELENIFFGEEINEILY